MKDPPPTKPSDVLISPSSMVNGLVFAAWTVCLYSVKHQKAGAEESSDGLKRVQPT